MKGHEFIGAVRHNGKFGTEEEARQTCDAVLQTLGKRLTESERKHLASQLPEPFKDHLISQEGQETFDIEGFYTRVAKCQGVDLTAAQDSTQVVMNVLKRSITKGELKDVCSQLPREYHELMEVC